MIIYQKDAFGINLLFRIHGSAVYRSIIPALVGVGFFFVFRYAWDASSSEDSTNLEILHPYACGLLIGGITFLIIFRLTQSYGRYWEAVSAVYRMQSKWMDASIHCGDFHLQSTQFDKIKPPSFRDYPHLDNEFLTRDRERLRPISSSHQKHNHNMKAISTGKMNQQRAQLKSINAIDSPTSGHGHHDPSFLHPTFHSRKEEYNLSSTKNNDKHASGSSMTSSSTTKDAKSEQRTARAKRISTTRFQSADSFEMHVYGRNDENGGDGGSSTRSLDFRTVPRFLTGPTKFDGNWSALFDNTNTTYGDPNNPLSTDPKGFASIRGGRTPSLFLQELAHLTSLMNAVALATLRNDVEGVESPLGLYDPGSPWPPVDPGDIKDLYDTRLENFWQTALYFLGKGRSPEERTKYNAARPLPVVGGVSDGEIYMLQMARGPLAKTQLCWSWLSEFVNRESSSGSMGIVGQALMSRVNQFLSDGMLSYNDARKIMFCPFPFPHAQLSSIFVNFMVILIPLLMDQYINSAWLGMILSFLSVMCLSGVHEVARELENPFRNVPNELPVVTFQAEFNEALLVLYAGYHPDFYWQPPPDIIPSKKILSSNTLETKTSGNDQENSSRQEQHSNASRTVSLISGTAPVCIPNPIDEEEEIETDVSHSESSVDKEETTNVEQEKDTKHRRLPSEENQKEIKRQIEMKQLRYVVEQQGQLMEQMLKEQSKLNQMVQDILHKNAPIYR